MIFGKKVLYHKTIFVFTGILLLIGSMVMPIAASDDVRSVSRPPLPGEVVISEIMSFPLNPAFGWLELQNMTGDLIDLTNCVLLDGPVYPFGGVEGMITFPPLTLLPPHAAIVVAPGVIPDIPTVYNPFIPPFLVILVGNFQLEPIDNVALFSSPDGSGYLIDGSLTFNYPSLGQFPGQSIEKIYLADGWSSDPFAWKACPVGFAQISLNCTPALPNWSSTIVSNLDVVNYDWDHTLNDDNPPYSWGFYYDSDFDVFVWILYFEIQNNNSEFGNDRISNVNSKVIMNEEDSWTYVADDAITFSNPSQPLTGGGAQTWTWLVDGDGSIVIEIASTAYVPYRALYLNFRHTADLYSSPKGMEAAPSLQRISKPEVTPESAHLPIDGQTLKIYLPPYPKEIIHKKKER